MLVSFVDQIPAYLLAQSLQLLELFKQALGPIALSWLLELMDPLLPTPLAVEFLPPGVDGQTAIQRPESAHPARAVIGQGTIAAAQFLQRKRLRVVVVHSLQHVGAQKIGQLARIDLIVLVPALEQSVSAWIAYHYLRYLRLQHLV